MLTPGNKSLTVSSSPHSLALQGSVTTPSYANYWVANQKAWNAAGMQGLNFDGTGILGSGLFSGDFSTWGTSELVFGLIGMYAMYAMMHQAKQTKYRLEGAANRSRKRKAKAYRERAKKLEDQSEGFSFF